MMWPRAIAPIICKNLCQQLLFVTILIAFPATPNLLLVSVVRATERLPATAGSHGLGAVVSQTDQPIAQAIPLPDEQPPRVPTAAVFLGDGTHARAVERLPTSTIYLGTSVSHMFARLTGLFPPRLSPSRMRSQSLSGWHVDDYFTNFEGEFPQNRGMCTWHRPPVKEQVYGWGKGTDRAVSGTYALWPAGAWVTDTVGVPLLPGMNYPHNLLAELICELTEMEGADNVLVEFDLWHELADPDDRLALLFFVGEYTGDGAPVYHGISWQGAENPPISHDWTTFRVYYPLHNKSDVVRIKLRFESDAAGNAAGPWLDNLRIQRYDEPVSSSGCADLDPTIHVSGIPGNVPVSKGLVLPPYAEDDLDARVQRLKEAGVQWVRLEFVVAPDVVGFARPVTPLAVLSELGEQGSHIDLKHYDELIDALCANGIAVLGLLDYQSVLSQSWRESGTTSDDYLASFTAVSDHLVRYFANRIGHWEVWNEPDFAGTHLRASDYARLLTATHSTIKAANPDATVLFGGLGSADTTALRYLQALYPHLPTPSPFDIFAIHPYPSVEYDRNSLKLKPGDYMLRDEVSAPTILHKFLAELKQHGDGNKEVWVTELGWNSALDSPLSANCPAIGDQLVNHEQQAAYLHESFDILFQQTAWGWLSAGSALLNSTPSITKVFWFQYRDTGILLNCNRSRGRASASTASIQGQVVEVVDWWYGLFDGNFQPKAAQMAFRCYPQGFTATGCVQEVFLPLIQN